MIGGSVRIIYWDKQGNRRKERLSGMFLNGVRDVYIYGYCPIKKKMVKAKIISILKYRPEKGVIAHFTSGTKLSFSKDTVFLTPKGPKILRTFSGKLNLQYVFYNRLSTHGWTNKLTEPYLLAYVRNNFYMYEIKTNKKNLFYPIEEILVKLNA